MTPHAARRLFTELTNAEIAFRLQGIPVATYLKRRANRHLGEVKRELLRVAALGEDANLFMTYFLEEFKDEDN